MLEEVMLEISRSVEPISETENIDNKTENEKTVSKCKIIASHCFALITIMMFKLTYGFNFGFSTIIVPELRKADAEIKMSLHELTWFASYCFMPPVGAILSGLLAQFIGCRMIIIICGMSYITSHLIFYFSANAAMLLSAQAIAGFADGMHRGPSFTFLAEISLPQFRSTLMTLNASCVMIGFFVETILSTYLYWRTLPLIKVIYPTVGLVLIYFVPETPYWLASKNRYEDAKRSLAWFRGWTTPESVETEMRSMLGNSERTGLPENTEENVNSSFRRKWHLENVGKRFISRSFYIPFLIVTFAFVINNFCGLWPLSVFSTLVFEEINSPVDPHIGAITISAIRVIASILYLLFIKLGGKRKLLFITLTGTAILLITAAIFVYLTTSDRSTSLIYRWTPTISIFVAVFIATVGIDTISLLLNSEIFPANVRYVGVGAGHFINLLLLSLMNKIYLYIVAAITMSGTLLFFAVVNIAGLVGTYFFIPETEGKSLKEIEEHFN